MREAHGEVPRQDHVAGLVGVLSDGLDFEPGQTAVRVIDFPVLSHVVLQTLETTHVQLEQVRADLSVSHVQSQDVRVNRLFDLDGTIDRGNIADCPELDELKAGLLAGTPVIFEAEEWSHERDNQVN